MPNAAIRKTERKKDVGGWETERIRATEMGGRGQARRRQNAVAGPRTRAFILMNLLVPRRDIHASALMARKHGSEAFRRRADSV